MILETLLENLTEDDYEESLLILKENLNIDELCLYVENNLNLFIDDDLQITYENIKNFSFQYILEMTGLLSLGASALSYLEKTQVAQWLINNPIKGVGVTFGTATVVPGVVGVASNSDTINTATSTGVNVAMTGVDATLSYAAISAGSGIFTSGFALIGTFISAAFLGNDLRAVPGFKQFSEFTGDKVGQGIEFIRGKKEIIQAVSKEELDIRRAARKAEELRQTNLIKVSTNIVNRNDTSLLVNTAKKMELSNEEMKLANSSVFTNLIEWIGKKISAINETASSIFDDILRIANSQPQYLYGPIMLLGIIGILFTYFRRKK